VRGKHRSLPTLSAKAADKGGAPGLTNAFSKTLANMRDAVALYVAFYNFCCVNRALGNQTPAMVAGLTDHMWTLAEILSAA